MRIRNLKNSDELLNNSKYLIKDYKNYKGKWDKLFEINNPIYLEIGMGKGNFIIDMALKNPNINFIGLELYSNVIARACKKLENINLSNLKIINANALELNEIFDKEISKIFLNFSDPWPKKRNAKRRLTSEVFLSIYDNIFKDKKIICMKTDNITLFESSILSLSNYGYKFKDFTLDLWQRDEDISETEYEHKFKSQGIKILYFEAEKEL